jgi:hypothetical protein
MSTYGDLPPKECQRIIDNIIDNDEIKEILVSKNIGDKSTSLFAIQLTNKHTRQTTEENAAINNWN